MQSIFRGLPSAPSQQRGMATILIIMLMGLALTVTASGVMYSVRTSQEQQVTVHAATHSQAGVWTAAEAVGLYLKELDKTVLMAFNPEKPLKFKINANDVVAKIFPLDVDTAPHHLRTEINYTDTAAKASSTLEVVYNITLPIKEPGVPGGPSEPPKLPKPNTFYINKNLDLGGNAKIIVDENTILNVSGVLNFNKSKIEKIDTIRATSDITIDTKITVKELYSNGIITISGDGAEVGNANAVGLITISGAKAEVGSANANGLITISGAGSKVGSANANDLITISGAGSKVGSANANGLMTISSAKAEVGSANANDLITISGAGSKVGSANARGAMDITGADVEVQTANAGGNMSITGARDEVQSANAVGNVAIEEVTATVKKAQSMNTVTCPSTSWDKFDSIIAGKTLARCTSKDQKTARVDSTVSISPPAPIIIPLVPKLDLTPPKVDAYLLKDQANYVFTHEEGQARVKVKNINGIEDGKYYLYKIKVKGKTSVYICRTINCPTAEQRKMCINDCNIEYNNSLWTLSGNKEESVFAPGILWFEGDLELGSGNHNNSIIASGSISVGNKTNVSAINYNGYETTCTNQIFYPTNLCDIDKKTLTKNSTANIALLAGGYKGDVFSGGTITLQGGMDKSILNGSVIAGDTLVINGSPTIRGYITTAGQGTGAVQKWTGSFTIDVTNLPESYMSEDDNLPPSNGSDDGGGGSNGNGNGGTSKAEILWSRYL